jgi:ABC-type uncharacterized transport system involved in gliding motility auxiliary subunit
MSKARSIGRLLGVFGLLLLLTSPFTLFVTAGSPPLFALKALLGALLLGVYFATNYRQFGQFASRRSSFFFLHSALLVLAALGALVALNVIAHQRNRRWDLTERKVFTLSPQTLETLAALTQPVHVTGFIPPEHPAYEALRTMFERYRVAAPQRFDYDFKDPRRHPDLAAKYQLREEQTQVVLETSGGEQQAHTVLNVISEEEMTNAIARIVNGSEQRVYFVTGHGEWPLDQPLERPGQPGRTVSLSELKRQLTREGYTSRELNLGGGTRVPPITSLVVLAAPKAPFTPAEVESLRLYLAAGGRLLYFAEAYGEPGPELAGLLASYGIRVDPGVVADAQFNSGNPYVVVSLFYGDHASVRPLSQRQLNTEFPTARGLSVLTRNTLPGVKTEVVVTTSPFGWEETTPDDKPAPGQDERKGQIPLVVLGTRDTSRGPAKRSDEARLGVVGDSEMLFDSNWGHEGNRNLVMNLFGWATHQDHKITIRPPDRATSSFPLDAALLDRIRFITTDVLPLTLLGVGLAIWLTRRNQ